MWAAASSTQHVRWRSMRTSYGMPEEVHVRISMWSRREPGEAGSPAICHTAHLAAATRPWPLGVSASCTPRGGGPRPSSASLPAPSRSRERPSRRWKLGTLRAGGDVMYIKDSISGSNFLVDTGASRSVWPFQSSKQPYGPILEGANSARIPAWGARGLHVKFG
jgi:hypothetical protein